MTATRTTTNEEGIMPDPQTTILLKVQELNNFAHEKGFRVIEYKNLYFQHPAPAPDKILKVNVGRWDRNDSRWFDDIETAKAWIEQSFATNGHGGHRPEDYEEDYGRYDADHDPAGFAYGHYD